MCGICASVILSSSSYKHEQCFHAKHPSEEAISRMKQRGPDCFNTESYQHEDGICINFCASVLHLRGQTMVSQPLKDKNDNVFLWNGEIFGGYLFTEDNQSDTAILSDALLKVKNAEDILSIFGGIQGPWAFVYFQKNEGLLWFGRDIFGRRSLLWHATSPPFLTFNLSSVAQDGSISEEVSCEGIHCLDILQSKRQNCFVINTYPWSRSPSGMPMNNLKPNPRSNVQNILCLSELQIPCPITEILNKEVPSEHVDKVYNYFVEDIAVMNQSSGNFLQMFLEMPNVTTTLTEFERVLSDAVRRRIETQPYVCSDCIVHETEPSLCLRKRCAHSSIGILFSGGLDSIVIAVLSDRYIPSDISIDLINVAFDCRRNSSQKRKGTDQSGIIGSNSNYDTPDRITGRKGVMELQLINPARKWNLVEVNVSQSELEEERSQTISGLIIPSCTVLDDSIGCALWFAARGKGVLYSNSESHQYCSPARVLLVGMGADEQLAGYSRHRGKFSIGGWSGVLEELSLELDRISSRNLGRDDRIISNHGREARFPFLDENVVSILNIIPIWLKANLNYPRGIGEKLLLRLLAFKLGLKGAALLPKRAIQFGSRIARSENYREKGSDVCERLMAVTKIAE